MIRKSCYSKAGIIFLMLIIVSSSFSFHVVARPKIKGRRLRDETIILEDIVETIIIEDTVEATSVGAVTYIGEDTTTGGSWKIAGYGLYAHILPGAPIDRLEIPFGFYSVFQDPGTGTPGYWMNHPEAWPVESIEIGGVTYPKGEAIEHMKNETGTDMTYSMFQALVAAKLNVMIGNDDTCIADIIDPADEWMAEHPLSSLVEGSSQAWGTGEPLKDMLDEYNNGLLPCAPSRDDVGTTGTTRFWEDWTLEERVAFFTGAPYYWDYWQVIGLDYVIMDPPYYDEYVGSPTGLNNITYSFIGTKTTTPEGDTIQYPAFIFAWDVWHDIPVDSREVYYEFLNGGVPSWKAMTWDDGGERGIPHNGYFNVTLSFPPGSWRLALYAYDFEKAEAKTWLAREQQTYRIFDQDGNPLVGDVTISGVTFDNGVYVIYQVTAGTEYTIVMQVYNSGGHYPVTDYTHGNFPDSHTINVVLSGIFIDLISP